MANGAFLGGVAEGISQGTTNFTNIQLEKGRLRQQDRQFGQSQAQQATQFQQQLDQQRKDAQQRMEIATGKRVDVLRKEVAEDLRSQLEALEGSPKDKHPVQLQAIMQTAERFVALTPEGSPDPTAGIMARIQAASEAETSEELAARKGTAAGISAVAQQQTERALGLEATEATNIVKLQRARDRAITEGRTDDAGQIEDQITRLGTVVGRTPQDVSGTRVTQKQIDATRIKLRETQANLEELEITAKAFADNPSAGGVLGALIEGPGGLIQQIPILGDVLVQASGVDPAEIKAVRSSGRAVVASMLTTITKEESGRFTDSERKIASEVLGTLEKTASSEQIQAAMQTVVDMVKRARTREANQLLNDTDGDLVTDEGLRAFANVLVKNGFTLDSARDVIIDLQTRRGLR